MLDWLMKKLGYSPTWINNQLHEILNNVRNDLGAKRKYIVELERELEEANEALNYLPRRFIRELGRDYESDPPLWMPVGIGLSADIETRPYDGVDVFTMRFDCRSAINMTLDSYFPVGEAGFMVDKMTRQIAGAVQHELATKGMVQLSQYLQKKDKEHAA